MPDLSPRIGPVFQASYHGTCPACEEHISPGDQVRYIDHELSHAICLNVASRPVVICQTCFLTKPCGCDD